MKQPLMGALATVLCRGVLGVGGWVCEVCGGCDV